MNTIKTLLVAAVLSTVAYGLYSNYGFRPSSSPPPEAGHWDTAPQVQLPPSRPALATNAPAPHATAAPNPVTAAPDAPANPTPPTMSLAGPQNAPQTAVKQGLPALPAATPPTPSTVPAATPVPPAPTADPSGLPGVSLNSVTNSVPSPGPTASAPPSAAVSSAPTAAPPAMPTSMPPINAPSTPANPYPTASPSASSDLAVVTPTAQPMVTAPPTAPSAPGGSQLAGVTNAPATTPTTVNNPYLNNAPPAGAVAPVSGTTVGPVAGASPQGIAPVQPQNGQRERFVAAMGKVQTLLDNGQLAPALQMLTEWHDDTSIPADEHVQLLDLLDRLAATVIYSRDNLLEPAYSVQTGDTLMSIGERYQVPWQLLGKINGIVDPSRIPPGTTLKVLRGPFEANVNLRTNEVTVLLRGHYAGRFPCAVGQDAPMTAGEYTVNTKNANPIYYGPTIVDADDPNNPLGERQLVLGGKLSLHGTTSPQGLNPTETRGSIRLSNADVEDLFDILSVGSRVVIRR